MKETLKSQFLLVIAMALAAVIQYNSCRERHYLTRSAILTPDKAPWMHLYNNGDNISFLDVTGFSRSAFNNLLGIIYPPVNPTNLKKRGRPSTYPEHSKLGLYLCWAGSTMRDKDLALIFGMIPTTVAKILDEMRVLIIDKLLNHPDSAVRFPTSTQINILCV
jgi:hypothetical protein